MSRTADPYPRMADQLCSTQRRSPIDSPSTWSGIRELNSCLHVGNVMYCPYTNAAKMAQERFELSRSNRARVSETRVYPSSTTAPYLGPGGTRTHISRIKSPVLSQLSYKPITTLYRLCPISIPSPPS